MIQGLSREDRLRALGLAGGQTPDSEQKGIILTVGEEFTDIADYETFSSNYSTFRKLEDGLVANTSLSETEALLYTGLLQGRYDSYGDYQNDLSNYSTFSDWSETFSYGTTIPGPARGEGGETLQGIRYHETPGVSRNGEQVPAGTVEIFGERIEFSRLRDSTSADDPDPSFSVSSFTASPTNGSAPLTVVYEADVTNVGTAASEFSINLLIDDETAASKSVDLDAGETRTVSFSEVYEETTAVRARIEDSPETLVVVTSPEATFT